MYANHSIIVSRFNPVKSTESKTTTASQTTGVRRLSSSRRSQQVCLDGEHQFFGGSPAPFSSPNLPIGAPGRTPYEREADATAEKVVGPFRAAQPRPALSEPVHSIQRMPAPVQALVRSVSRRNERRPTNCRKKYS